jgi:hypothetical protein
MDKPCLTIETFGSGGRALPWRGIDPELRQLPGRETRPHSLTVAPSRDGNDASAGQDAAGPATRAPRTEARLPGAADLPCRGTRHTTPDASQTASSAPVRPSRGVYSSSGRGDRTLDLGVAAYPPWPRNLEPRKAWAKACPRGGESHRHADTDANAHGMLGDASSPWPQTRRSYADCCLRVC